MRNVCKKVSFRPTGLICWFCWNDTAGTLFPATTTQLFSQSLSSHMLCSCLEVFSTTSNLWNFWHSNLHQISAYAFCSRDGIITQKWNCRSPNNLCKCSESPSTLSTNTSIEWNLYLSWSNHLVTSFRLELDVGSFSEHQNKTSDTDGYKGYFFTARVSQVNVNTMKRVFEEKSELQVAKCLTIRVLSSSYNVSSLQLPNKRKRTQQWSFRVAHDIVLNQVRVYHERMYADNVVSKFWFVRSFRLNITPNSLPTLLSKVCPRSVLKIVRPNLSFAM